jgi:hypothetical protein
MKVVKSLILGSAAGILAFGSAQAADLPVKAKAVEYVKVCSLYGAGFYYIPGSDTCIKIGGYVRVDTSINSATYGTPLFTSANGEDLRTRGLTSSRVRSNFNTDTRTATEYGVLRTYASIQMQWTDSSNTVGTSDGIASGAISTDFVFMQFAGFTFGKAVSQFDPQWVLAIPSVSSGHIGGSDTKTGIMQAAYTASFGNGFSGTISLEAPKTYRTGGVLEAVNLGTGGWTSTNDTAGTQMPDVVGNVRLDQAWGSLHFAGAVHNVEHGYNGVGGYGATSAGSKTGYALSGGFELKNLPTGAGDTLRADFTYAHGAARYVFGGTQDATNLAYLIGTSTSITPAFYSDGIVNGAGSSIDLSTAWSARVFYEHYWSAKWRTSLYGIYARQENNSTNYVLPTGVTGNTNFSMYQVGSRTAWTPVKDLTFSGEVLYTGVETNLQGVIGGREIKNQGTVSGIVSAIRSF